MEKLYEVKLGGLKFIDKKNEFYQYKKEPIKGIQICIMDGEKFVDIENNREYEYLKSVDEKIVHSKESLEKCKYVIEAREYTKDSLSENEVSLNHLRALRARRLINNRNEAELQKNATHQKR